MDSAVEGLTYESGALSGFTGSQGEFQYEDGGNVTFSIGGITLPAALGQPLMTPVQLVANAIDQSNATVTNVARLLQTLDDDDDPLNGITITPAVRAGAAGLSVDFNQSIVEFGNDATVVNAINVLTNLTSVGQRPLVTASDAQNHLESTILGIFAGAYSGTFSGTDSGTWSITIDSLGAITGNGFSNEDGFFGVSGTASSSGATTAVGGSVTTGATFQGMIELNGSIGGTWVNSTFGDSGTWSGSKN